LLNSVTVTRPPSGKSNGNGKSEHTPVAVRQSSVISTWLIGYAPDPELYG